MGGHQPQRERDTHTHTPHIEGGVGWGDISLTFVVAPGSTHAISLESKSRQLRKRLCDIEVTQGADLKEGHVILQGIQLSIGFTDLAPEGKVQPVSNKNLWHTRGMLGKFPSSMLKVNKLNPNIVTIIAIQCYLGTHVLASESMD